MRDPKHVRLAISVCIALSVSAHCVSVMGQASQAASVNAWLRTLRYGDEKAVLKNAYNISAFFPFSENTVLILIDALNDPKARVRIYAASALGDATEHFDVIVPALIAKLADPNEDVREHVTLALAKIGEPAVPSLVKSLDRMNQGFPSRKTGADWSFLEEIVTGKKGVTGTRGRPAKSARRSLQRTDARVADYAAMALMNIGDDAIPQVAEALNSNTLHVRKYAEHILVNAGDAALPVFVEYANHSDPKIRDVARSNLPNVFGRREDVLAVLRKLMKSNDAELRNIAVGSLEHFGITALPDLDLALRDSDERVRLKAVVGLQWIAEDTGSREVLPPLLSALNDQSDKVKTSALRTLIYLEVKFQDTTPLLRLLKSPEVWLRQSAAQALGKCASPGSADLSALIEALSDVDLNVRIAAANSLSAIGLKAQPAIPALLQSLRGSQQNPDLSPFRQAILPALGNIEKSPEILAVLTNSLKDEDSEIQVAAAFGLKALGEAAAGDSIPALIDAIQSKVAAESKRKKEASSSSNREATAGSYGYYSSLRRLMTVLAQIEPGGASAFLSLLSATNSDLVRTVGAGILGELKLKDRQVVPTLTLLLKDANANVRRSAVEAMGEQRPVTKELVSVLVEALKDSSISVRVAGLESLKKIGPDAPRAVPGITLLLHDRNSDIRLAAAKALAAVDPASEAGVLALVQELGFEATGSRKDNGTANYYEAVHALLEIGPPAVPAVARALKQSKLLVRRNASQILALVDIRTKDALPGLIDALKDSDAEVRRNAAQAIGGLGAEALSEEVTQALIKLLTDNNREVRVVAADALFHIGFEVEKVISTYSTVTNDDIIESLIAGALPDLVDDVRPPSVISAGAAMVDSLPQFPWPPPRFSDWYVLPKHLLGSDNNTLGDVRDKLGNVLSSLGYDSQGLFEVPDGFALVTRVERINEDGTAFPSPNRWTGRRLAPGSLREYLRTLFLERPGQFRLFVFIFTPLGNFGHSNRSLSEDEAWNLANTGGRVLPLKLQETSYRGYFSHALIYVLKKKAGQAATIEYQDALGPETHLRRSGILNKL